MEQIESINTRLVAVENTLEAYSHKLEHWEDQLERMSGRVDGVGRQVDSLQVVVADSANRISSLESVVSENTSQIAALQETVNKHNELLIGATVNLESLIRTIDGLSNRMLALEQRYTTLLIATIGAFLAALAMVVIGSILG
jgi:chromosome segregation ATPase